MSRGRSDRGIIARISLIVRNLVNQGFWQYASLANRLLGVIKGKLLAIAPKWGDIPKVDPYCYFQECYTESFCIISSYTAKLINLLRYEIIRVLNAYLVY
ncbi:MAG: hypothetical protein EWV67_03455 [Microcystis sp. M_QC_C_20170808_M2Col]|nr:MAG: hypothetical protein EWV68_17290 [Microcystis sp. M_QC_C_20170808_M9Col]TRT67914.1 MAG: hypothetical protein EWV67_03455 [Microcystis sp. M_QC_C_20170808_M2Col]